MTEHIDIKVDELEILAAPAEEGSLSDEKAEEIISTTREMVKPEVLKYLTQEEIDKLSETEEGQEALIKIIERSNAPEAKRLIFAIKDTALLFPTRRGCAISHERGADLIPNLEGVRNNWTLDDLLADSAWIQELAISRCPHVFSEEDVCEKKKEPQIDIDDVYRMLEAAGLPRSLAKSIAPSHLKLMKIMNTPYEKPRSKEWLFVMGIPIEATTDKNKASYKMFMAPRYSYDEVAMARELEKRTGQKFLPELSSTPTHGIPDPNMEQVYLAGGHILLEDNKDENGKTIKTATIRTGIHHFRECHKVILEKCKAAMMRKLGVDQVKFEYR